jgi:uncharacterized protein YuzE
MKIKYDKEADVMYIHFSDKPVAESKEETPGIIIDFDSEGNMVGIEMLQASMKVDKVAGISYEVA